MSAGGVVRHRTLADFYFPALEKAGLAPDGAHGGDGPDGVRWSMLIQKDRPRPEETLPSALQIRQRREERGRMSLLHTRSEERARSGRPRADQRTRGALGGNHTVPRVGVRRGDAGGCIFASPNPFASLSSSSSDDSESSEEPTRTKAKERPARNGYKGGEGAAERARERSGENIGALAGKKKDIDAALPTREPSVEVKSANP